jgi:pimeloyl-ACP methyl ester carboxylesterase
MPSLRCRGAAALFAALLLVLPASTVHADDSYQTPNGQRTVAQMADELHRAAYAGPWDDSSVVAAYGRTTGGTISQSGAPTSPGAGSTTVILVPGMGSSVHAFDGLIANGYIPGATFLSFSYSDAPPAWGYTALQSCQSVRQSEDQLDSLVHWVHDRGSADSVILIGHSLGGVLAYDVAATSELSRGPNPFIRGVMTIDAPLGGISAVERFFATEFHFPSPCPALANLRDRSLHGTAEWQPWLRQAGYWLLGQGVHVAVVTNPEDAYVDPINQGIVGPAVNYTLDYTDGSYSSHSAILGNADALAFLANLITQWRSN